MKAKLMKKMILFIMSCFLIFPLASCGANVESAPDQSEPDQSVSAHNGSSDDTVIHGLEDGVLTIAVEGNYAPYNWTQTDDSDGAVRIKNSDGYANGYDIMIAKIICEAYDWELEIIPSDWASLIPQVQTGQIDAAIAGQSMTAERLKQVDFAGPYYYADIVCVTRNNSEYADAAGISDLSGAACTAQADTIWYDKCLPQIENAQIQKAAENVPEMLEALEAGEVDLVCTDLPAAQSAVLSYSDLKVLDFSGTEDDFSFTEEEYAENINIGISVQKGNSSLVDAINNVLDDYTVEDYNSMMEKAISIAPAGDQ